jgi:hypothetical protein
MKTSLAVLAVVLCLLSIGLHAQEKAGLPFGLRYGTTRSQATTQLAALADHRVDSGDPNTIAYVVPAPDSDTKNGLFLEFHENKLVEISSMKSRMPRPLYDKYVKQLLSQASGWVAAGMTPVMENKENSFYLYRDLQSYVNISGSKERGAADLYSVTLSFIAKEHFERTNPEVR